MKILQPGFAIGSVGTPDMASQTRYVWAAPVKRQTPLHAQPAATSSHVWAWRYAMPPIVMRRTVRFVMRPAVPMQLPRLLGRSSRATTSAEKAQAPQPLQSKAPPKGEPPVKCVATTPMSDPGQAIPEPGVATAPAPQTPLPPLELVYPNGQPVSFGPANPFLDEAEGEDQQAQEAQTSQAHTMEEEDEESTEEPPPPPPRPPEASKAEPAQFGQAELDALLAEVEALGLKLPEKPKGEAQAGQGRGEGGGGGGVR